MNKNNNNDAVNSNGKKQDAADIYLTSDSTLQTPAEDRHDKNIDPEKDNTISVSNDDLHTTQADRLAGSDRAGTSERKDFNEPQQP